MGCSYHCIVGATNYRADMGTTLLILTLLLYNTASVAERCMVDSSRSLLTEIKEVEHGESLTVRCSDEMELHRERKYLNINETLVFCSQGKWTPELPRCINKRCSVPNIANGQLYHGVDVALPGDRIASSETVSLECEYGYELYDELTSRYLGLEQMVITCDRGYFAPRMPLCKPKQCKMDAGRRLLPENSTYTESGANFNVSCPDRFELFRNGIYLDENKTMVSCSKGTWIPDLPRCINKRCSLPMIDNSQLRKGATMFQPGEKILSGEKAQLECNEGFELHNGTYIDSDRTDIECNEGSFMKNIPSCKEKRCQLDRSNNLLPQINYTESGSSLNVSCPENLELTDTGVSEYGKHGDIGESVNKQNIYVFCKRGTWTPKLPRCSLKSCKVFSPANGMLKIGWRGQMLNKDTYVHHNTQLMFSCDNQFEMYAGGYVLAGTVNCFDGSLIPGVPECRPRRCFIDPPLNLEYFIGGNKSLDGYIDNGTLMQAKCSDRMELVRSDEYLDSEQVSVTCSLGTLEPGSLHCMEKRCNITKIENGQFIKRRIALRPGEMIPSSSLIGLICADGFELYNETTDLYLESKQIYVGCFQGSFTAELPTCKPKRCLLEPPLNLEYFIGANKVLGSYIDNGTLMQARCPDRMELVLSAAYVDSEQASVICNVGTLEPGSLDCKDKRCKVTEIENGLFTNRGNLIDPGVMIQSSSNVRLLCANGYELYNERTHMYLDLEHMDIQCYQGSFTTEIPTCKARRCLIEPPVKLEYYIGATKVLNTFIDNGTLMQARCPDRMELVSSAAYLNSEQASVKCIFGTLDPGQLACKNKRCKITKIENGRLTITGTAIGLEEMIPSSSNIRLICDHGYEMYDKRTYKYLELQHTDIQCFQGSFTSEIPTCKPTVSCPSPKQPIHGRLVQEAYNGVLNKYQSTIRYYCDEGYRMVGPQFRKCQADRTWSGNDTKCEEILCDKPSPPEYGQVHLTDNSEKVGSQIEYICDEHHIMEPITSQFAICTEQGHWSNPKPRCIKTCKVRALSHGSIRRIGRLGRKITEDTYVPDNTELIFTSDDGYEMYASSYDTDGKVKCFNGVLLPGPPESRPRRCLITSRIKVEYFKGARKVEGYVANGTVMEARCPDRMELVRSGEYLDIEHQSVICNMGTLDPGPLDCKEKRCKVSEIENGQFENERIEISLGEMIQSGSKISVTCADGYELYNETKNIYLVLQRRDVICYQGSFNPEIPTCKPRRCLITSRVNAEYFKGARKVEGYVANGTVMEARCPDRMELVRSGEYLDIEHQSVICNMGTLDPGPLDCKEKRCQVPEIENGQFIKGRIKISPGEMIWSSSKISVTCADGYELYNETKNIYLEQQRTNVMCYQGTFNPEIPTCKTKVCNEPPFKYLIIKNGTSVNKDRIFSLGTKLNASCDTSSTLHDDKRRRRNGTSAITECSYGEWEPNFSCKKTCTLPKGSFKYVNPKYQNETKKEGDQITHGRRMVPVCPSNHKEIKKSTCLNGTWVPSFEGCAKDIGRCSIPNDPGMQFTYIQNGTEVVDGHLEEGDKVVASCNFGYEIDTPSGSEIGYKYDYSNDESTAYSVIVPKAKDSEKLGPISNGTYTCRETGKWEPEIRFTCKQTCTLPKGSFKYVNPKYQNVTKKEGDQIIHGRRMVPVCPSIHKEIKKSTCLNGTWVPSFEGCAKGRCSIPNDPGVQFTYIQNGTEVVDGHLVEGDKVVASCKFGYEIDTPSWSESVHEYDYSDDESTAYSVIVPKAKDSEKLGPISNGTYTCRETGKWEPEIRFTCKPIICRSLDDYGFENGRITYWSPGIYKVGTVASFTCNPGYRRDGPAYRTCQEDGTWSGTCVTCQSDKRNSLTMCPAPCVPDWAKKTGSYIHDLGSRVEFQCFPTKMQYSGDSSNIRHCVNDSKSASWNGTLINCKGLRDVTLRMIADGVADVWVMLSEALGIQSNHMILADDNPSRKALDILQYWRDIVMRDKPKSLIPDLIIVMETLQKRDVAMALRSLNGLEYIRCKHPPLNGTVKPYQSDYLFGQSVRVSSCDDGYMLVNQGYLVCSEKGTWFGNSTCRHAICSPECGINGKCVRDKECRCSEGFSGKTCDEKIKSEVECESLPDNYTIIQNGVVQGKLSHQTVVEISCNNSQAPFDDYKRATCKKGFWDPWKPFCQNTCSLQSVPGTLFNDNISRDNVRPPVSSGRKIKVTCEKEYIPVPQLLDVSTCVNGVWKPAITRCEKKVSCATPRILNVIVDPLKETYEVNENVSLTGCLNGLDLVGSRSLLCLKDGSWHGNAQCTSYCQNGRTSWNATSYKRASMSIIKAINYLILSSEGHCFDTCKNVTPCKAVQLYKINGFKLYCWLLPKSTKDMPDGFVYHGPERVYDRVCEDTCVLPNLNDISFHNGGFSMSFTKVQDGTVLSIKCKGPGQTAVPDKVTCMGGQWSHQIETISCKR